MSICVWIPSKDADGHEPLRSDQLSSSCRAYLQIQCAIEIDENSLRISLIEAGGDDQIFHANISMDNLSVLIERSEGPYNVSACFQKLQDSFKLLD